MKLKNLKGVIAEIKGTEYWRIYLNTGTGELIGKMYESENSWDKFSEPDIIQIMSGYGERSIFGSHYPTMKEIKEAVEKIL